MSGETFLMRFSGGPQSGNRILDPETVDLLGWSWPLPNAVAADGGLYQKVSESQLQKAIPGVLRGAEYIWVPEGDA